MIKLSPTRHVIYGTRVPIEDTPVVEVNHGSTVVGNIDVSIQGLTGIVSVGIKINKLNAPTKTYKQYEFIGPDLYSSANTYYNYTGAGSGSNVINWRCSVSGITGAVSGDYYGLSFSINQNEKINKNIKYQPDIVLQVNDPISKDAI